MEEQKPVTFRLPASMVEKIDAYARLMGQRTPGLVASRTDAVRVLLSEALVQHDAALQELVKVEKLESVAKSRRR